ncbi:MAG: hypothetical protein HQK50_00390 [Oligoflexia bacterium]|nr:hypothetical protein [Oligoflexia bacterium]MBF0363993.1 hypothetical protein [Oligoflexia bacterium]
MNQSINEITSSLQCIFIDDEKINRLIWELEAHKAGVSLITYNDPNDFLSHSHDFNKELLIFLDQELGDGMPKGDEIAKHLHEDGFENIYIATYHNPHSFEGKNWIKGVINKKFPLSQINEWISLAKKHN